jgi:hypothetical protein
METLGPRCHRVHALKGAAWLVIGWTVLRD